MYIQNTVVPITGMSLQITRLHGLT